MISRCLAARDLIICAGVIGLAMASYLSVERYTSENQSLDQRFSGIGAIAMSGDPAASKEILEVTIGRLDASQRRANDLARLLNAAMLLLILSAVLGAFARVKNCCLSKTSGSAPPAERHGGAPTEAQGGAGNRLDARA